MPPSPEFGFEQLRTELLRGLADTVADRPGETEAQRFARHQSAIFSVMALLPRDAIETILAGQCVMFDHLLRDATRDLLRSEAAASKLRIRSQVAALGRLFLKHLEQLRLLQARPGQQTAASLDAEPQLDPAAIAGLQPALVVAGSPSENAEPIDAQARSAAAKASTAAPAARTRPSGAKANLLLQHGFQNRRMRRVLQFKKPANQPVRHGSPQNSASLEVAPQLATGSRPSGG